MKDKYELRAEAGINFSWTLFALYCLAYIVFSLCSMAPLAEAPVSAIDYETCFTEPTISYVDEKAIALATVKSWESLRLGSYYDVNAFRNGWGTRSRSRQERISLAEADRRCEEHFDKVLQGIQISYPDLTSWQQLVLTVMDYNVKQFGPGLRRAILSGDDLAMAEKMKLYVNVRQPDGSMKPYRGLRLRREAEVRLLLSQPHERQEIYLSLVDQVDRHILNAV